MDGNKEHENLENVCLQPWSLFKCENGKQYLIKKCFRKDVISYSFMLYDGTYMWKELLERIKFEEQCKKFNPNVETESAYLMGCLETVFEEGQKCGVTQLTPHDGDDVLCLTIKCKMAAGFTFNWTFELQKCDTQLVEKLVWTPAFIMVDELLRRQQDLIGIIEQKDREIQFFRDQGVLSDKCMETQQFQKQQFNDRSDNDENFKVNCQKVSPYLCMADTSRLYEMIMKYRQQTAARDSSSTNAAVAFDTLPVMSQVDFDTVPIVNDALQQQNVSADVSSGKSTGDDERRAALEKRLQDETEKKKSKKKRKLNL